MKVFISGPISGKPNYNREAFFKAEEELEKHGYSVWNPAWFVDHCAVTEFSKDALQAISNEVLRHCDAIYMLKGWMHSEGAWNEHEIAEARELVIMYEGKCCWDKEPEDEHDVLKRHIKTVEEALAWERWKNRLPVEAINVRNIQNTFKSELDSVRNKLTKYTHIIQALTGRPIDEIVKSWDMCDNGFGVNYRFNPNGRSTLDISMSRTKREVLLEKENEELKKRLKSDYVTPLIDRVDVCEEKINELVEKINEHEEDLDEFDEDMEDRKKDISEQDRRLDCHHNRLMSLTERVDTLSKQYKDLGKELDDYIDDYKEADEALERRIKTLEKRSDDWYELQQVRKDVTDLVNSVNSVRLDTTSNTDTIRELQEIYDGEIDIINKVLYRHDGTIRECQKALEDYTEAYKQLRTNLDNTDNTLERRIKAIEKRLNIKPFYAPTEDEKDD